MLAKSCGAVGVEEIKSTIEHERASMGSFCRMHFKRTMVIAALKWYSDVCESVLC